MKIPKIFELPPPSSPISYSQTKLGEMTHDPLSKNLIGITGSLLHSCHFLPLWKEKPLTVGETKEISNGKIHDNALI